MRRISIDSVRPGMVNAKNIYSASGKNLLSKGVVINEFYIRRLKALGVHSLYVQDGIVDDIVLPEVISEKTRVEMVRTVHHVFTNLSSDRALNTRAIQNIIGNIIEEIFLNSDVLIQVIDIRAFDDYTFQHSINVCLISLMIGTTLAFNQSKLRDLGVGALLHDVGKIKLNKAIIEKPGALTPREYEEIKKHTVYGFEILKNYFEISLLSSHVAFQHHERNDGSGYPRGLLNKEIHEYARIVSVVDVYDALISDRSYRSAFSSGQALEEIRRLSGIKFDPEVVAALIKNVAKYPVGTIVQLSNGDIGVVIDVSKKNRERPVVRRFMDGSRRVVQGEIKLTDFPEIQIVKTFEDEETYHAIRRIIRGDQVLPDVGRP
ncbi:MAG: HD-GYP domain-containing protein [Syntrophomonadaceae bacterium]|nr:HD-GYP domain-containing protein [Syntrophomonadaceae bacterium]